MSVKQGGIKYHFKVFGMIHLGIEPRSPGSLAIYIYDSLNTLSGGKSCLVAPGVAVLP